MPSVSTPTPAAERMAAAQPIQQGQPDYINRILSRFGHHLSHQQQSTLTQNLVPVLQTSRQGGLDANKDDLSRAGASFMSSPAFTDSEEDKRKNAQELQRRQLAAVAMAAAANGSATTK
ncbi:hypothetical protein INT44_009047 [Umbelopsis vinacea]|uniref:Uncharacterized protein n=1 Tax=Umbelopsis vinacea TaxID=44442 RepID=A0A8H7Q3M5_9FUNG|nr:hypothetical protein INT44_009047 [Umbelopsis vinacea]